jgi:hypothetical protein
LERNGEEAVIVCFKELLLGEMKECLRIASAIADILTIHF